MAAREPRLQPGTHSQGDPPFDEQHGHDDDDGQEDADRH